MTVTYPEADRIKSLIEGAQSIVIIQADNPDADSLGSALALEHIIGELGKEPQLYCGVHIPDYLHYLEGWDRVENELPGQFDLSIIVDTSADSLFGAMTAESSKQRLATKPCIILDHHPVELTIPFATVVCNPSAVATGEVIYELAGQLGWPLPAAARNMLTTSILADSMGLTTEATSARSIHIVAELVEQGVIIPALEQKRRELMRKSPELLTYKGQLLQRVAFESEGRIATVVIPWDEIERYSYLYNPSMLVLDDMRSVTNVGVAVAFKVYNDGKITAKIRANYGFPVAGELASRFGGGGHTYASGFKITDGRSLEDVKASCIQAAAELLDDVQSRQ
jgi:phosphoesterase RecJ-like protein